MKVYWTDRNGTSPPPQAIFECRAFDPGAPSFFKEPPLRIYELPSPKNVKVLKRRFIPNLTEWSTIVRIALSQNMDKIVLARCQILELAECPDPFALTATLKQQAQGSYVFCFSEGNTAFFGASPERLFCREGARLASEAMAGTRRRGNTIEEDHLLGKELLNSDKDLREFSPIVHFLRNTLSPCCETSIAFSPTSLHKTQNVQHLYSECTGHLVKNICDADILARLHPTPALCGVPTEQAFALIRKLEPFDRGLYGGVIGWRTPDASDWVVGIRTCLIRDHIAYLYAGTGIVAGSKPEEEWEELNHKNKLYDAVFR